MCEDPRGGTLTSLFVYVHKPFWSFLMGSHAVFQQFAQLLWNYMFRLSLFLSILWTELEKNVSKKIHKCSIVAVRKQRWSLAHQAEMNKFKYLVKKKKKSFLTLECHYVRQSRATFGHQIHEDLYISLSSIHGICQNRIGCDYWWIPESHSRSDMLKLWCKNLNLKLNNWFNGAGAHLFL